MSSDKRRKVRVQGGWAAPSSKPVKSDSTKLPIYHPPAIHAWLASNSSASQSGQLAKETKYVYEDCGVELKKKPEERVIVESGVYDLGKSTDHGVSRIRLFNNFISAFESKKLFDDMVLEIPWMQKSDRKNGVDFLQPRLTAWYGEHSYSYSGVTHQATKQWPTYLLDLKQRLENNTGLCFNAVLANFYRNGHDSVAWHADDEASLGQYPNIASLSFGDTRSFQLRQKLAKDCDEGEYEYVERAMIPLTNGSLLIMEGATQEDWQHRIPREYHNRGARINLTFRVILPKT